MTRRVTVIGLALAGSAALAVLVGFLVPPLLEKTEHYATIAEALAAGMRERGWLPDLVPESAYDITEWHDLDSNESAGVFRYDQRDEAVLAKRGRRVDAPCLLEIPRFPAIGDWPAALVSRVTCEELLRAGFVVYRYSDPSETRPRRHFGFALDSRRQLVAYWTETVEQM